MSFLRIICRFVIESDQSLSFLRSLGKAQANSAAARIPIARQKIFIRKRDREEHPRRGRAKGGPARSRKEVGERKRRSAQAPIQRSCGERSSSAWREVELDLVAFSLGPSLHPSPSLPGESRPRRANYCSKGRYVSGPIAGRRTAAPIPFRFQTGVPTSPSRPEDKEDHASSLPRAFHEFASTRFREEVSTKFFFFTKFHEGLSCADRKQKLKKFQETIEDNLQLEYKDNREREREI